MATSQGWDPKRREKEVKEAVEELHKKRQAAMTLRSGLEKRGGSVLDGLEGGGRLVLESRPALREVLRERWRAEVGVINLLGVSPLVILVIPKSYIAVSSYKCPIIGGRWGQIVDEPLEAGEAGQGGAAPAH